MNFIKGFILIIIGLGIWAFALSVLAAWWAICFGSIIIGIALLIFAPMVLLAPLVLGVPGTALLATGIELLDQ